VLTAYSNYPGFNSSVVKVTVLRKDDEGAELLADRKTKIGRQAHAFDRYGRDGDLVLERTYEGVEGSSTWTVRPVDAGRSTLTIGGKHIKNGTIRPVDLSPSYESVIEADSFRKMGRS
jgi:hypothetical protein